MEVLDGTSSESSEDDSLNIEDDISRKKRKLVLNESGISNARSNVEFYNYSETAAIFKYNCVTNTYITFTHNYDDGCDKRNVKVSDKNTLIHRRHITYLTIPGFEKKILKPKGISATVANTSKFRVQMTSKTRTNNKYTCNVVCIIEALWVYECFLLLLDKPVELYQMILHGNYHTIVSMNLVSNELDYYYCLGCWIKKFVVSYSIFNKNDAVTLMKVYDDILSTKLYGFKISSLSFI